MVDTDAGEIISQITRAESGKTKLNTSLDELIEIIRRLTDTTVNEDYNRMVNDIANQIDRFLVYNGIHLKRADILKSIEKRVSQKKYKSILRTVIKDVVSKKKKEKVRLKRFY